MVTPESVPFDFSSFFMAGLVFFGFVSVILARTEDDKYFAQFRQQSQGTLSWLRNKKPPVTKQHTLKVLAKPNLWPIPGPLPVATKAEVDKLTQLRNEVHKAVTDHDTEYQRLQDLQDKIQEAIAAQKNELASKIADNRELARETEALKRSHAAFLKKNEHEMAERRTELGKILAELHSSLKSPGWDDGAVSVTVAALVHRIARMQRELKVATFDEFRGARADESTDFVLAEYNEAYAELENTFRRIERHSQSTEAELRSQLERTRENLDLERNSTADLRKPLAELQKTLIAPAPRVQPPAEPLPPDEREELQALRAKIAEGDDIIHFQGKVIKNQQRMSWSSAHALAATQQATSASNTPQPKTIPDVPESPTIDPGIIVVELRRENDELALELKALEGEVVGLREQLNTKWGGPAAEETSPSTAMIRRLRVMTFENKALRNKIWELKETDSLKMHVEKALKALEGRVRELVAEAQMTLITDVAVTLKDTITPHLRELVDNVTAARKQVLTLQAEAEDLEQKVRTVEQQYQDEVEENMKLQVRLSGFEADGAVLDALSVLPLRTGPRSSSNRPALGPLYPRRQFPRLPSSQHPRPKPAWMLQRENDLLRHSEDDAGAGGIERRASPSRFNHPVAQLGHHVPSSGSSGRSRSSIGSVISEKYEGEKGDYGKEGRMESDEEERSDDEQEEAKKTGAIGPRWGIDQGKYGVVRDVHLSSALTRALGPKLLGMARALHPYLKDRLERLQQEVWAKEGDIWDLRNALQESRHWLEQSDLKRLARLEATNARLQAQLDAVEYTNRAVSWGLENYIQTADPDPRLQKAKAISKENAVLRAAVENMGVAIEQRELMLKNQLDRLGVESGADQQVFLRVFLTGLRHQRELEKDKIQLMRLVASRNGSLIFDYEHYETLATQRAEAGEEVERLLAKIKDNPDDPGKVFWEEKAEDNLKLIQELRNKMEPMQTRYKELVGLRADYDASVIRDLNHRRLEMMGIGDEEVGELMDVLHSRIRGLCSDFSEPDPPEDHGIDLGLFQELTVIPVGGMYRWQGGRQSLMRAFIWTVLIKEVFSPMRAVWAEGFLSIPALLGSLATETQTHNLPLDKFSLFQLRMANYACPDSRFLQGHAESRTGKITAAIIESLAPHHKLHTSQQAYRRAVEETVKTAIVLDYLMARSRPMWRLYMYEPWETLAKDGDVPVNLHRELGKGVVFDPEGMARVDDAGDLVDEEEQEGNAKAEEARRVTFVAWPVLERVGTNEGCYEEPVVVRKRGVVVDASEEL